MLFLPWLLHVAISEAKLLEPRQTGPSKASELSSITSMPIATAPACCWIWNGFTGVKVNTWYPEAYTQYTATVITTFVQHNGSTAVANTTTLFLPSSELYTSFGLYGGPGGQGPVAIIPGIPTDLIPSSLLGDTNYAATTVVSGDMAAATFDFTDLTIYSPTPYAIYSGLGIYTADPVSGVISNGQTTTFEVPQCGSNELVEFITVQSGAWQYINHTELYPYNAPDLMRINSPFVALGPIVQPLKSALPNDEIWIALPEGFSAALVANKTFSSMYPWITNCYTLAGIGQPTVHALVNDLTSTSSVYLTVDNPSTPVAAQTPTLLTSTARIETPARTIITASPVSEPIRTASKTADTVQQPGPETTATSHDAGPPLSPTPARPEITLPPSLPTKGTVVVGSTTATYEVVPSGVVIAGQTLSAGGQSITFGGQTIALVAQSNGPTALVAGTSTQVLFTPPQQTLAVGGQVLTIAAGTSAVLIDGTTILPGQVTIINGQTLSLAGTNLVAAGSGITTTQGIGGAIISGIGGGRGVTYTGLACKHAPKASMISMLLGLVALLVC